MGRWFWNDFDKDHVSMVANGAVFQANTYDSLIVIAVVIASSAGGGVLSPSRVARGNASGSAPDSGCRGSRSSGCAESPQAGREAGTDG